MITLEDSRYSVVIKEGIIRKFMDLKGRDTNLADAKGNFGAVNYTLLSETIKDQPVKEKFCQYEPRYSKYNLVEKNNLQVVCHDTDNGIRTTYELKQGLILRAETSNAAISEFGMTLDLNFMGKKEGTWKNQILPTSPYTSEDGKYMYCMMAIPDGRFLVAAAKSECDGWKIKYSPFSWAHYIRKFYFLASFDKIYEGSFRKSIEIELRITDSIEQAYGVIHEIYNVPYCRPLISGNFNGQALILCSKDTKQIEIRNSMGKETISYPDAEGLATVNLQEYGLYTVTPYGMAGKGMNTTIWNGNRMQELFDKSCETIRKPYHCDDNLCEGGCFLWAEILNMLENKTRRYDDTVREELAIIMAGHGEYVDRKTILPFPRDPYKAYHIAGSDRIQEQFFASSILMHAYQLYGEDGILEYAVASLLELIRNWMKPGGMIWNGVDYTSVCAPVIAIVDMSNTLTERKDRRAEVFRDAAIRIAEYLLQRGFEFPTEGIVSEEAQPEMEEGSIACTALSVLYVCANLQFDERYIEFAKRILDLHEVWVIQSADARMYQSSFRWWETIWEGDGEGPAICAGHAWTIWGAEALYYYGILTGDEESLIKSWNGYITNFSKTQRDGTMYSCYEVDYIRGGGCAEVKDNLKQLHKQVDKNPAFTIAHSYPQQDDRSLSRYVWIRNQSTWLHTCAIVKKGNHMIGIHVCKENDAWVLEEKINCIFLGKIQEKLKICCNRSITIISLNSLQILKGECAGVLKSNYYVMPSEGSIVLRQIEEKIRD